MRFKVGDRVNVISSKMFSRENEVYEITDVYKKYVYLKGRCFAPCCKGKIALKLSVLIDELILSKEHIFDEFMKKELKGE